MSDEQIDAMYAHIKRRVKTWDELHDKRIEGKSYAITPLLPRGGIMLIAGPEKTYKSMLALNLAYQMAGKMRLWNYAWTTRNETTGLETTHEWFPDKELCVLYMEQEIGELLLQDRIRKITMGPSPSYTAGHNVHFISKDLGLRLDDQGACQTIEDAIKCIKPDILIIDPLRWFHDGDENSNTDMFHVDRTLLGLAERYHLGVIVLHHTAKPHEGCDPTKPSAIRGAGTLSADASTIVMITKPIRGNDLVVQLNFTLRCAENPLPVRLILDKETLTFHDYDARKKEGRAAA